LKLDVLIVTKQSKLAPEFEKTIYDSGIPVNDIIVETSKPLGPARERAIQKATTERFVWLDDDVWLPENWYADVMKYWQDGTGWLEGVALPNTPKWYADWNHYTQLRPGVRSLKLNERSFNCSAIVVTKALKDWKYPEGEYLGFGSEDLLMSNYVTKKGYLRLRVPVMADHRIDYHGSFWKHTASATKAIGSLKEYHRPSMAIKYGATYFGSGCKAAVHTGNLAIIPNAFYWSWLWFRDMTF
jgi:hypothetical protein